MPKQCDKDGCNNNRFGGGYCKYHQYLRTDKKQKRLPFKSAKRIEEDKLYIPIATKFKNENPLCKINSPVCTKFTQGVHHPKGRGIYLLAVNLFIPACNPCNDYCEDHHAWAVENGFKESKFTPVESTGD